MAEDTTNTKYKRYMVFTWDRCYPHQGLDQVEGSFDDLHEAIDFASKTDCQYATVFDRIEGVEIG